MSGFAAEWLALREPYDRTARGDAFAPALAPVLGRLLGGRAPLRVLDLGGGTGANLRCLGPRLVRPQVWTVVDHDRALLSRVAEGLPPGLEAVPFRADLADLERLPFADADLVTASALLDLVSEGWVARLLDRAAGKPCLFALTYDGGIDWAPIHPADALVKRLFDRHQRTDKGFGPALGPTAPGLLAELLAERGWSVERRPTPWRLDAHDHAIQARLIADWATATAEIATPEEARAIEAWRTARLALVEDGRSHLVVGHEDLLAIPPGAH